MRYTFIRVIFMNENDAWNAFLRSGSIQDYLNYKAVQNSTVKPQETTNEDTDRWTDNQTTEYW